MSHGVRHATGVSLGSRRIERTLQELPLHVRVQLPVTLSHRDEPEPDYCLVNGEPEDFAQRHPGPADLLLVVEVADSSLSFDRTTKCRMYATANVAVYWIVNLVSNCVEVMSDPAPERGEYASRAVRQRGESVTIPLPGGGSCEVEVDSLVAP